MESASYAEIAEERPYFLVRLARAWRPRQGWAVFILAWAAVISLPIAAVDGRLILGLEPTIWLATLGLLLAWWLTPRRISGLTATGVLALAGVVADLIWGVRVVRIEPLVGQLLRWLGWLFSARDLPAPAITYFQEQGTALATFGQRVGWWIAGLVRGQGAPDNLVVIGLAGLLAWALAAWAAWWVAQRGQPFAALLPTGIVLAPLAYWAEGVRWVLVIFLATTTLLLVLARLASLMASWEREGVDYSPEMVFDVFLTAAALACAVSVLAPTLPFLTSARASQAFWRLFEDPYRALEERVGSSFAAVQPARSFVPPAGVAPGGLPRAHLLGGRPELGQEVALRGQVRGAQPDETLYWRGQTFARYSGRGWDDAEAASSELRLAAGEAWNPNAPAAGLPLVNQVEMVAGSKAVLYAAGEPVAVDRPYRARLRAAGELIALSASDAPARYTILSQVSAPDPARLRQAGAVYPSAIISLYLQLPAELDPRLADLAAEWASGAATPYDRAIAIESALRRMPYTLDVPEPPAGREVVSWFLFDLGRGYCDYFASALVVLARLNGIPARLAVGYAGGAYDAESGEYTITELNAHSWPELYFPGNGWLRFEPTPAQPTPERLEMVEAVPQMPAIGPGDLASGMAELRALAAVNTSAARRRDFAQGLAGVCSGLLLASWLAGGWADRRRRLTPIGVTPEAAAGFRRLARWGARLGRPPRNGDTPREYAAAVAVVAAAVAGRARWWPQGASSASQLISADATRLVDAYERVLFGPAEAPTGQSARSAQTWSRLWAAFRRLWWARWLGRDGN